HTVLVISLWIHSPHRATLFPYTTLFRSTLEPSRPPETDFSEAVYSAGTDTLLELITYVPAGAGTVLVVAHNPTVAQLAADFLEKDRKSTRLNSSHVSISYAVFCLKKKKR